MAQTTDTPENVVDFILDLAEGVKVPVRLNSNTGEKVAAYAEGLMLARHIKSPEDLTFSDPYVLHYLTVLTLGAFDRETYEELKVDPAAQKKIAKATYDRARQKAAHWYEQSAKTAQHEAFALAILDKVFFIKADPLVKNRKIVTWNREFITDETVLELENLTAADFDVSLVNVERELNDLPPLPERTAYNVIEQRVALVDKLTKMYPMLSKQINDLTQVDILATIQIGIMEALAEESAVDPETGFRPSDVGGHRVESNDAEGEEG